MTREYENVFITDSIINKVIISDAFITEDGGFGVSGKVITDDFEKSSKYLRCLRNTVVTSTMRREKITTDDFEKAIKYFNSLSSIDKREVTSSTKLMIPNNNITYIHEIVYTEFKNANYEFLLNFIIKEGNCELEISDSVTLKEELLSFAKDKYNIE